MKTICGVDISKARLDACIEPGSIRGSFANDAAGIAGLEAFCRQHRVELVAMEATGGYEFEAACEAIGRPYTPDPMGPELGGSTDFGNISTIVPALHADLAVHSWPAVNHQHEFAAHCVTPAGDRTLPEGATALALTALVVAADPGLLTR